MPLLTPQLAAQNGVDLDAFASFKDIPFPRTSDAGAASSNPTWGLDQLAALDGVQRHYTQILGMEHGIPLLAGQATAQLNFLSSIPLDDARSEGLRVFAEYFPQGIQVALEKTIDLALGLALDALQGAVGAALDVVGSFPIAGWIAQFVAALVRGVLMAADALKGGNWTALKVDRPVYDPDQDANDCRLASLAVSSRDWTGLFSPGPVDLGLATNFTMGSLGVTDYPTFAGRKTPAKGEWVFAQFGTDFRIMPNTRDHFGFVPTWDGYGGRLWRGALVDKERVKSAFSGGVELVGAQRPTAESMLLQLWRAVQNPYGPQIFYVDARALELRWRNYLVQLRKGLHVSHERSRFRDLKDLDEKSTYGEGVAQKRMWLSFASIDDGDLEKKKKLRKAVCNALVPVFGWAPWQDGEDKEVGEFSDVNARSDAQYLERYGIENSAPVQACRALQYRQIAAAKSVTALYSLPDDPAMVTNGAIRSWRDRAINYAMAHPGERAKADHDMIPSEVWQQAAGQLWTTKPGAPSPVSDSTKSQLFKPATIWLGGDTPPATWPGFDPGKAPRKTLRGTGGGAAGPLLAVGAAGVTLASFAGVFRG